MGQNMFLSRQLAQFACPFSFEDLSPRQIQKLKLHFLDWLGAVYAGRSQVPIEIILEVIGNLKGEPECTLIPDQTRTMSLLAAWGNSASSCLLEMDDLHRESIFHPASVVLPAVLAMAEKEHASGREVLTAMAVGYELGIRIALGVGVSHYRYWHPTATCGTFAAAAGAAKILRLEVDPFVWALGSAGTQASGLWEFLVDSAMSKPLHIGKASMNGVIAALTAQKGLSGARRILEGEKGFFRATSQDSDERKCLEGLGEKCLFEQTSLKLYASCGHTHPVIDAVLQATRSKAMATAQIAKVEVYTYQAAMDLMGKVELTTPTQGKFHVPFCVATALKSGGVGFHDFSTRSIADPDTLALMGKIRVHTDPELSRIYPRKWAARVMIFTQGGEQLYGFCENPKGDPENPLSEEEVMEKFNILTGTSLSSEASERIVERVLNLEKVKDVASLF